MKSVFKITGAIVTLVSVMTLVYFAINLKGGQIESRCSDVINFNQYGGFGADLRFLECYGILAKEQDLDDGHFQLYDHMNKYIVAVLSKEKSLRVIDYRAYLLQPQSESYSIRYDADLSEYYVWYYSDGRFKQLAFKNLDQIPKYISVDINNGEVTIYPNNLEEITEVEKKIFQELEAAVIK